LDSYERRKRQKRKEQIEDIFVLANLLIPHSKMTDAPMRMPWEVYPDLFAREQEAYEEQQQAEDLEAYKERRRQYAAEHNRRRQ